MNIKGQGHSLTFVQGNSGSTFSNCFSSKNTRPIEAIFHMGPSWDGRMKVSTNGLCHMTKTAPMPIHAKKNFQNLFLWNRKADELETWYAASSTRVLPSLFKRCSWVDTELFYGKVKFGLPCFYMGKS